LQLGVVTFSYTTFDHFGQALERDGHYTINLGDNSQTIAARNLLARLGARPNEVVEIDRDTLTTYAGPQVALLMNAVFRPQCFPIPDCITPIFLGFCARPETIFANAEYFKQHQPIGCRDVATALALRGIGIEAFVSGCVTLTFERRRAAPSAAKTFTVYGAGAGELPEGLLSRMPPEISSRVEVVFNRLPTFTHPLDLSQRQHAECYEAYVLSQLRMYAGLVITPLHHIAAPSLAMGIPTLICRRDDDSRFGFLKQLTRVYTPGEFDDIDWFPSPTDVSQAALDYEKRLETLLSSLPIRGMPS
jgi:hypothetical protein